MTVLLEVDDVTLAYDRTVVVRDVSLSVPESGIMAVLGANGAGKSTLAKAIAGLLPLVSGRVTIGGESIDDRPAAKRVGLGISLVPEGRELFPSLSVRDHLRLGAFRRKGGNGLDEILDLLPALASRLKQEAGTLSGGEQQMLAIGRGLMSEPKLLILDEPSLGLSPVMTARIFELIKDTASRGVGVLLIEQNARAALALSDNALILERGRVAVQGPSEELRDDEAVQAAYLGVA